MAEQVFGALEVDPELARLQVDARRENSRCRRRAGSRNRHGAGSQRGLGPVEVFGEAPPPGLLLPEAASRFQVCELAEQGSAVHEKCLAGLVAAEAVEQFDGAAAPDPEDLFEGCAV